MQAASAQMGLFAADRLPRRPYCSDDFQGEGLYRRPLADALTRSHIQHNPDALVFWLAFDIDRPGGADAWRDANLPPPNIATTNPKNGHAHLLYGLELPIPRTDAARAAPLAYLAAVEYAMRRALKGDDGYAGLITKNPLNKRWRAEFIHARLYTLDELAEWITLPKALPKRARGLGLGRNVALFDEVRAWGYRNLRQFKATGNRAGWTAAVLGAAEGMNTFREPLPLSEVRACARSVAKWIWTHFDLAASDARFSKLQAHRGKAGNAASVASRQRKSANRAVAARVLRDEGKSMRTIAAELGVGKSTVARWLA